MIEAFCINGSGDIEYTFYYPKKGLKSGDSFQNQNVKYKVLWVGEFVLKVKEVK